MLSPIVLVVSDGKEIEIPAKEIVPGDIIILKEGDILPADARLIEVISLQVNEASLTGESMPVRKETGKISRDASVLERKNMVFSGTSITNGKGKAVVVKTGMKTEFGKIAEQVTTIVKEETPLETRTKELGKWFGLVALIICIAVIIIGLIRGIPFISILMFSIALAVAAVPEALPAVVIGSLAIGMYKMAKSGALVRKMSAVETLGSTTVICSDKTGTLTKGEMTVRKVFINNQEINVSGVGYEPKGNLILEDDNKIFQSENYNHLMHGLLLCNDAKLIEDENKWRIRGDPTEGALIVVSAKARYSHYEIKSKYPRINEFPFSSERKLMTTIHSTENGDYILFMKGATEVVLEKCNYAFELNKVTNLTENQRNKVLKNTEHMAKDALRVLAIAYKKISPSSAYLDGEILENDLTFLGLVGMMDPPRKEATDAVKVCKNKTDYDNWRS